MDVYHRVLVKLYETTGGKDTETVDLKELVKKEGFLGAYPDIFQHLNRQSWISETARRDAVKITHWGVKEAKKSQTSETSETGGGQDIKKDINRTISETRELIKHLEELSNEPTQENITKAEKKLNEINSAIQKLKENV
jgi:hypothetical protein